MFLRGLQIKVVDVLHHNLLQVHMVYGLYVKLGGDFFFFSSYGKPLHP